MDGFARKGLLTRRVSGEELTLARDIFYIFFLAKVGGNLYTSSSHALVVELVDTQG